jgi:serine/threonine protein kinase
MQRLNHPFCLKINEIYESENSIYLVIDYVKNGDLKSFLKELKINDKELKKSQIRSILKNILIAVSYINS